MKPIRSKSLFYLLSFTWGLPMNIAGLLVAVFMLFTGHRPHRWGPCLYFNAGRHWGGASWGMFFITDKVDSTHIKNHEMGHAFQNCYLGFLMPFVIGLPSMSRYWFRNWREKTGRPVRKAYDSIWFEGSATKLGFQYWEKA